ncbi:hypothetical protein CAL7716_000030 [Calothrix sp. PCC 7716]|nr:hypothetical protein CAL7716_000030 [Calothrix sp. PCC 7716]
MTLASDSDLRLNIEPTKLLHSINDRIRKLLELPDILKVVVEELRLFLTTDRVMVYKFHADNNGQVIAESINENKLPSLLNLNFPADDIPAHARELFVQSRIRSIVNVDTGQIAQNPVNVNGIGASQRSVDPCHAEYLTAMGVQFSIVVPILYYDQLWGLLVSHHSQPLAISNVEVDTVQTVADLLAVVIAYITPLQELKQTQTQLIQTEKMSSLGQLVAGIAHEINNPVNFIYGNINHVHQYVDDILGILDLYQQNCSTDIPEVIERAEEVDLNFIVEDLPKMLSSIKLGTDRIRQIVLSLRNFSRLDQAEIKPVNIHEGIDSTLVILQHRLKAKPESPAICIIKEYGDLPLVECYAGQINQVFMNVLSNAIDALGEQRESKQNTIIISTNISQFSDNRPSVLISIADNGCGMPEHVIKKIFDPFFTTKEVGQGTGLGLSISYQIIVDKHSGTFKCKSQPGEGTEFLIEIPVRVKSAEC